MHAYPYIQRHLMCCGLQCFWLCFCSNQIQNQKLPGVYVIPSAKSPLGETAFALRTRLLLCDCSKDCNLPSVNEFGLEIVLETQYYSVLVSLGLRLASFDLRLGSLDLQFGSVCSSFIKACIKRVRFVSRSMYQRTTLTAIVRWDPLHHNGFVWLNKNSCTCTYELNTKQIEYACTWTCYL